MEVFHTDGTTGHVFLTRSEAEQWVAITTNAITTLWSMVWGSGGHITFDQCTESLCQLVPNIKSIVSMSQDRMSGHTNTGDVTSVTEQLPVFWLVRVQPAWAGDLT